MITDVIFCGLIVCGGVIFAAHFPCAERQASIAVAMAWALQWAIYNATWLPLSPHRFIDMNYSAYWSLLDLTFGAYVGEKALQWQWGKLLFTISVIQISCHVIFSFDLWNFFIYSSVLDYFFYIQAIVFICYGAGGLGNLISSVVDSLRNALGEGQTAQK